MRWNASASHSPCQCQCANACSVLVFSCHLGLGLGLQASCQKRRGIYHWARQSADLLQDMYTLQHLNKGHTKPLVCAIPDVSSDFDGQVGGSNRDHQPGVCISTSFNAASFTCQIATCASSTARFLSRGIPRRTTAGTCADSAP